MTFRSFTFLDASLLLRWRNDPLAIQASFTNRALDETEHAAWVQVKLGDPNEELWIGEAGKERVGFLRISYEGDVAELHFLVAPEHRFKGYAGQLVSWGAAKALLKAKAVTARVKKSNVASLFVCQNAGLQITNEDQCGYLLRKERTCTTK